jgi:hypothetical protein
MVANLLFNGKRHNYYNYNYLLKDSNLISGSYGAWLLKVEDFRSLCSAVPWRPGVRVGELNVSPLCPASGRPARRRLPSRGSLGPHFPTFPGTMRRYDCHPVPLGSLRLSLASRYLACPLSLWSPSRARDLGGAPRTTPGSLVTRSPTPGSIPRRQMALPRSRVPPLKTCPALRPRWCPAHLP